MRPHQQPSNYPSSERNSQIHIIFVCVVPRTDNHFAHNKQISGDAAKVIPDHDIQPKKQLAPSKPSQLSTGTFGQPLPTTLRATTAVFSLHLRRWGGVSGDIPLLLGFRSTIIRLRRPLRLLWIALLLLLRWILLLLLLW